MCNHFFFQENLSVNSNFDNFKNETGLSLNADTDLTTAEGNYDSVKRKSYKNIKSPKSINWTK